MREPTKLLEKRKKYALHDRVKLKLGDIKTVSEHGVERELVWKQFGVHELSEPKIVWHVWNQHGAGDS